MLKEFSGAAAVLRPPEPAPSDLEDAGYEPALPVLRIGLLWHSMTSDNLGVGALTLANIEIVREAARRAGVTPRFVVLAWTDPNPPYEERPDVELVGLRLADFLKPVGGLWSQARGCDLVLDIGAGDSFADIYGLKRFGTQLAAKLLVLMAGRPLILSPQTFGPFKRPWVRRMALAAITRATAVATRDDLSTDFLRKIGYPGPIIAASDVALRLPYRPPPARARRGPLRVGINVSGLLMSGGYTRDNMFGLRDYPEAVRAMLGFFLGREGCEVHLVPHVISERIEVEDDWRASVRLKGEFPEAVLAPRFAGPAEAKSYIAQMDFFVGARMHACIAAFSSGVPVLPMAYSRKFAGLFGSLGYPALIDCAADDLATMLAKLEAAFEGREALRRSLAPSLARGLRRLEAYEAELGATLEAVLAAPRRRAR